MFIPKTDRIKTIAEVEDHRIKELESIFNNPTNIYIDFANVWRWQKKLGWNIDLKRMKQFFDSFTNIKEVKFYCGELEGSLESFEMLKRAREKGYLVKSKPVKIMNLSIDVSSVPKDSTLILDQFIRPPLLRKLKIENIEYLNNILRELNQQGTLTLEDRKCNFDVEISVDMLLDCRGKKS